jgi:hypothetical protein
MQPPGYSGDRAAATCPKTRTSIRKVNRIWMERYRERKSPATPFDGGGADAGGGPDHGGGELRSEFGDEGGYPSAEEAALHIVDEAPGAVKRDIDSYTGEPIDKLGTY